MVCVTLFEIEVKYNTFDAAVNFNALAKLCCSLSVCARMTS